MPNYNKNIKIIPFPDIDNAFVVISFRNREHGNKVKTCLSFLYDGKHGRAVEWEPEYGPITVLEQCKENHPDAVEHWFFPYYTGQANWSQIAVEREGLPELLKNGDYKGMFEVLKNWLI